MYEVEVVVYRVTERTKDTKRAEYVGEVLLPKETTQFPQDMEELLRKVDKLVKKATSKP